MTDGLVGAAAKVAGEMLAMFPGVVITSGRRSVAEQALAMARNVSRNRNWIAETYKAPLCRAAQECHAIAQKCPDAQTGTLAHRFAAAIEAQSAAEQRKLTKHITGEAFDVRPASDHVKLFLDDAAKREGGKFLTREGGLVIWHWQGP